MNIATTVKIAINFSYTGIYFHGSALQKNNSNTITQHLIESLIKSKIFIENPTLAGRTDKNVSAKGMVASFLVKNIPGMNYAAVIQSKLPEHIVINGYAFVDIYFNARYDCVQRHYKYFFLNCIEVEKMQICCEKIKKFTTFINLCKRSEEKNLRKRNESIREDHYMRRLDELKIIVNGDVCIMEVRGRSFMHNMVRKIFWVVSNYGKGLIDDNYLDNLHTGNGQCGIADAKNLIFCCATYKNDINWIKNNYSKDIYEQSIQHFKILYELEKEKYRMHKN